MRLRWNILEKHSNVVFTENTHSKQSIETNLLEGNDCLTHKLMTDSNLEKNEQSTIDDATILESYAGVKKIVVPQTYHIL